MLCWPKIIHSGVKSSAENRLEFRRNRVRSPLLKKKRPKGLVKSCWRTSLLRVFKAFFMHYYEGHGLTYAFLVHHDSSTQKRPPAISLLQKKSFSKACYLWKEPFRRKLYISQCFWSFFKVLQESTKVSSYRTAYNGKLRLMACKEGQFDVVELMENDQFKTFTINIQFECSKCEWNDSFWFTVHTMYSY